MFIGPFSVYLGGLLGPRRVLLFAAGIFTATCAFLPLIHNYSLLVTALIVAGLTSGTFYPLTLTFALRISPLRYLPFTMAFYATFIDGAVNIAPSLYGWYRDHLSWHWMFWNSAVITPLMIILIYFGIPAAPPRKKGGPVPSFAGFLYLSAGLALMFAAIQQGERLDWWRSGVFNALFWSGAFLTLCALIRRLCGPNPLVALPYLWQRNTVLLGALLFWFRFTLTGTIILIPQSLAIHGFEADQIGPAVIWSAVPLLLITFVAGLLLIRNLDPRLLLAGGLTCTAFAVWLNADLTAAWSASNYYRTELLTGIGQSVALIGLVGCIILQGVFSGGLMKPQWILTFSAFFHVIRLFGGTTGAVYMGHFLADREKLHSNLLGLHVQRGNWITDGNIRAARGGSVLEIVGDSRGHGPRRGNFERAASSSGIHAVHYRWILFGGLDVRYRSAAGCLTTQIADELWRAEHLSAAIGHASGARPSGGKIMNARTKLLAVGLFFLGASSMVRAQTGRRKTSAA